MAYTTDDATRNAFITQLLALAGYLSTHPDVPVPESWHDVSIILCTNGTDAEKLAEVDRLAQLLDAPVNDDLSKYGHYSAERRFGNLAYRVLAITDEHMRRYEAGQSYADSVIPETSPAVNA